MLTKVLFVFGTRPEAIKMAPLVHSLKSRGDIFETKVCVTAQHREMLDQVLTFFDIVPDFDLNLMKPNQNLHNLTAEVITQIKSVYESSRPDYVMVHGDTTTSMAAALAAYYSQIKICHIEAGLRTHNKLSPFPEEINRQITGRLADLHFAPTPLSQQNLLSEGIDPTSVFVTGNTVIDALFLAQTKLKDYEDDEIRYLKGILDETKKVVLVTGHRRENFGDGFVNICNSLKDLADDPDVQIFYPVHLNPNVQTPVNSILKNVENIHLVSPLSYPAFSWLMNRSLFVITDSGGIQEEAPSLGKPVLVMRENTERPEAVTAGTVRLVGTNYEKITTEARELLTKGELYKQMSQAHNPYGDGQSCNRILEVLINHAEKN
ncbi:UDP-N-acetylglucosamine 2-epimerase (non-hydrolyzing) [Pedobacter yulinensis]|uniref:UDP-N-acetylglucosamine 2-epimerase (non-hydrolyzing) n=1 Tax=Pedobacter yulinensis TaxID=2126353 RepID=A0A2T3HNM5_9SPHI|nr:UDP-N-acetylglucosamine 2-epimerase (non-hydrolyzing) [Pedobacter yulinensis]PST84052.1 UDP-N-acetylglucosamine 2-epimerase (non-hydrolyzing) [Pedobacter yulinensis]